MNVDYDSTSLGATALEDLLNLDFLTSSSTGSRSASSSPKLPPTPPQVASDPLFHFLLDDEYAKVDALAPPPTSTPFDFLGNFIYPQAPVPSGSPPALSPQHMYAIDPKLVGTPTPSKALSDVDEDEEHDEDLEDDMFVAPVKVGGKGKNRKGTVHTGGIEKKASVPKSVTDKGSEEPDDWRPSPEEYKKMSSKEKRQLRNKISARNFRVRRKEYITTLEGDIAERDRLIDAIRSELGSTKSENVALREEIDALKRSLLAGHAGPILPPPGEIPSLTAPAPAPAPTSKPSFLTTPNMQKDLPTSPRPGASARAFWAGNTSTFASFTPVHTTLIPDFPAAALAGKPRLTATAAAAAPPSHLQENINPALNDPHHPEHAAHFTAPAHTYAFDAFADVNPFTLKTLDAYRMQLWGKMAAQHHHQQQYAGTGRRHSSPSSSATGSSDGSPPSSPPLGGLAASLRPAFFEKPTAKAPSTPSAALLAGKTAPTFGRASSSSSSAAAMNREVEAAAALASQTLLRRLGSAFWDAFAGGPTTAAAPGAGRPGWDAEKVRRVLEGKAVVRVVDVDEGPSARAQAAPSVQQQRVPSSPKIGPATPKCVSTMTDLLEESMRTLSISKKSSV